MRDIDRAKCSCGGNVSEVETTDEEEAQYGCGRHGCCAKAFRCGTCATRFTFALEAPEWNP